MTSPTDRQSLPATVPALVGQQFIQAVHTSDSASLAALTRTESRHIGFTVAGEQHSMPAPATSELEVPLAGRVTSGAAVSVPGFVAACTVTAAINPDMHLSDSATLPAPAGSGTHSIGFNVSDGGDLPAFSPFNEKSHREFVVLQTPSQTRDFRFDRNSEMWGYWLEALSLYRQYGEWKAGYVPVPDEIEGVDLFFRGGHRHYISADVAAELADAGFSDYIRTEVSK